MYRIKLKLTNLFSILFDNLFSFLGVGAKKTHPEESERGNVQA